MSLHGLATPPFGAIEIDDQTIAGSAAQFTFTVPQNYRHLFIIASLRGAQAVTGSGLRFRFNGDTGTNYQHGIIDYSGTTAGTLLGVAQTYIACGRVPGASAPANYFGSFTVYIPMYRDTSRFKSVVTTHYAQFGTATTDSRMGCGGGQWLNTNAITSILLWHDNGAGTYDIGSQASLYGMV